MFLRHKNIIIGVISIALIIGMGSIIINFMYDKFYINGNNDENIKRKFSLWS